LTLLGSELKVDINVFESEPEEANGAITLPLPSIAHDNLIKPLS